MIITLEFIWLFVLLLPGIKSYKIENIKTNASESINSCDRIERIVHHKESIVKTKDLNKYLLGKWVSSECEVRPGPEFLLRQYEFSKKLKFILYIYYYGDKDCRVFLYGIKVWGQLKTERASWIVPGASENEVNIHRVDIIPYHDEAAKSLELKLSNYCPDNFEWSLFQSHTLYRKMHDKYNYTPHWEREAHDMKCLEGLGTVFNELQLGRLVSRPHHHDHKWRDELFFGDIHTKIKRRTRYRPTALQAHPLLRGHKTHKTCKICRKVALANLSNPPRLTQRFFVPVNLEGEWISRRCETRPNSLFLMRRLTFYPSNRSWEGIYSYFADEKCSNGVFKILAKGKYLQKGSSEIVHGGTNFDFKIKTAHLTPVAQSLANQLNHLPSGSCGIAGSWKVGVIQEVTSTGGCKGLGLTIPITELDLLKMESNLDGSRLLLSLGQTDTDAVLHNHKKEQEGLRPTSYQPPLLQCRMFSDSSNPNNELFPVMSHLKSNPLRNLVSSSNSLLYPSMTCTCSFLIISCNMFCLLFYSSITNYVYFM